MGSRILAGRYELLERIGEGGMAVVFKGRDRLLGRMVAVKILKPEYTKDSLFVESFRKESQLAASMVHQNIVNVYDVGQEGNINYIVMELIDGEPLSEIIKKDAPLEPHRATNIAKQVLSALSTAHKHQLIHRDVKPHNILLTTDGVAKITDFGIAKNVNQDTLVEDKEAVMGSVHYFSPEQARGAYVDERSDIYSLGIVLYEMLTGQVPFDGETAVEVAVKHMNEEMLPPTRLNPDIPQDLEDIIMKATAKLQVNRYKSADDMIMALNFVKFSKHAPFPEETKKDEEPEEPVTREKKEKSSDAEKKSKVRGKRKFKLRHPQSFIAIIIAAALAFPASSFVLKYFDDLLDRKPAQQSGSQQTSSGPGIFTPTNETVKVPYIVGLTEEEAKSLLKQSGLNLEIDLELASNDIDAGKIMSQKPSADSDVKAGFTVRANISHGPVENKVPGLVGKTVEGARQIATSYGYDLSSVSYSFHDDIPKDTVISQKPEKGQSLEKGGSISIVVSKGPEETVVLGSLKLTGLSLEEALNEIEAIGSTVGSITYTANSSVEAGHIISQNPAEGVVLGDGQSVDLVVSGDASDAPKPDLPKYTVAIDVDISAATESPFTLNVILQDGGDPVSLPQGEFYPEELSAVVTVTGSSETARVLISFGNQLMYNLDVNFPAGTYKNHE
ncbi:MAG: Stk1 family PASTA domain-containing Ser/Thr kinase [Firmicutes bacterium]|nr:Stk1 family PASTA domain-containing Ser/Thr kinase [Bacillota bacterium]